MIESMNSMTRTRLRYFILPDYMSIDFGCGVNLQCAIAGTYMAMQKFFLVLGAAALGLFTAQAQAGPYLSEFSKHWDLSKQFTIDVANAMPDANYTFKPNPEEMSFGEVMIHIGLA